ncbi:MAG: hypothetical protein KME46_33105 [Brasilonema angustatum HA4187-MV1]|nr:hypothetical protein [Brasilonema angustatum HA4187-MV1]
MRVCVICFAGRVIVDWVEGLAALVVRATSLDVPNIAVGIVICQQVTVK